MKTYFVDSFTTEKFKGNPAAVCFIENDLDDTIPHEARVIINPGKNFDGWWNVDQLID